MSAEITVVVPVRDGAAYLGEALASLLEQTLPPAAIVVVDDGSSDDGAAIARAAGAEVLRVGSPAAGVGPGAARNAGALRTRTELVAFMDADDRSARDRFARQVAELELDPAVDGVLTHMRQFLSPDKAHLAGRFHVPPRPMPGWHAGTLLIGRERFAATGGWTEATDRHDAFEWFASARRVGLRLAMLEEVLVERRIHGANLTVRERDALHARYLASARAAIRQRGGAA